MKLAELWRKIAPIPLQLYAPLLPAAVLSFSVQFSASGGEVRGNNELLRDGLPPWQHLDVQDRQ